MDRIEELVRDLNQEIIETRSQTIKTDNSLRNLVGDIKEIAKRQEGYERRFVVNSVAAYVLFAALSFVGLLLFFKASVSRNQIDRELVAQQQEESEARVAELEADLERRRQSEREAYEFFELLASGRRDEVVERFPTVQGRLIDRATIELYRREVERIRHELAREAYDLGVQNYDNELWQDTRDAFLRSLAYVELTHYSPDLHYRLGEALYELNDYGGAVRYYELTLATDALNRTDSVTASFHKAEALRRLERYPEALDAYRHFLRRYESHSWAATARQRVASIERRMAGE
jgi:tetratricopeptide (TPR) repeat protein